MDIHGAYNLITYHIRHYKITDSVFIMCGDFGIGFEKYEHYVNHVLPELHKVLKKSNCIIIIIRGNHDDPFYFDGEKINTKYVKAVPDYSIIQVCNKNILCIGGAVSIDRTYRQQTDSVKIVNYMKYHDCDYKRACEKCIYSWWENENVNYQPKVSERVDIICSHSAPSFCYPTDKGSIVMEYAQYDETLLEDIQKERETLDMIYNDYKDQITHWYYGHFHQSMFQEINNIKFRLLDIGEFIQHIDNVNDLL